MIEAVVAATVADVLYPVGGIYPSRPAHFLAKLLPYFRVMFEICSANAEGDHRQLRAGRHRAKTMNKILIRDVM